MIVGKLYRFKDLAQIGVRNYPTLYRWIETQGFPKGRLLGENTRVWTEAELQSWFESRPTDPPPDKAKPAPSVAAEGGGRDYLPEPPLNSEPDASAQASRSGGA
jgi:predicted DNA-binding transcriptional regulator AlpA